MTHTDRCMMIYTYSYKQPIERYIVKAQEQRREFIRLRAEGRSYSYIADALHISKGTCTEWERELKEQIAELKQEELNELYSTYHMTKEARIRKLGDTLAGINEALEKADLSQLPADKLLDYKLKYTEALQKEYTGTGKPYSFSGKVDPKEVITALGDLLDRIRAGEVTAEQAQRESGVFSNLLRAYDNAELKAKLDALESILGGRA